MKQVVSMAQHSVDIPETYRKNFSGQRLTIVPLPAQSTFSKYKQR